MKQYILQVMMFMVFHAIAMESVCSLNKMPKKAKDRIAHFLGWETKDAFTKRVCNYQIDEFLMYCNVRSSDKKKKITLYRYLDQEQESCACLILCNGKNQIPTIMNMPLAGFYRYKSFNFNKQGTYLLVRCLYYKFPEDVPRKKRVIFSLGAITEQLIGESKEENILEEYLRHHLVCKKIT